MSDAKCRKEIRAWAKRFRVLADWRIVYAPKAEYKGQCSVSEKRKTAWIYAWGDACPQAPDYLFHEVLHVAYRAAKLIGHEGEEMFVQDLCQIVMPLLLKEGDAA